MGLFSDSDLDAFLDPESGFGVKATYNSGSPEINVIFKKSEIVPDPYTGETQVVSPTAKAKTSDVPNAKHKDQLVINAVTYEVVKPRPGGNGMTTLFLNKIS